MQTKYRNGSYIVLYLFPYCLESEEIKFEY